MSWLYVPALVASNSDSEEPSLEPAPFVMSRGKPMPPQSLRRAWKKGGWIRRLYGLTCAPSTANLGVASWIASLAANPCQPFSLAGNRLGADDPRHLWPHVARIVREIAPEWCFFENVRGHVSLGLRDVRCELEEMGYRVKAGIFTASEVGAPHERARLFILAHADRAELRDQSGGGRGACWNASPEPRHVGPAVVNASGERLEGSTGSWLDEPSPRQAEPVHRHGEVANSDRERELQPGGSLDEERRWPSYGGDFPPGPDDLRAWADVSPDAQPAVCRMAHGLANRLDRLRACGNGVVPEQAALAYRTLRARFG